MSFIRTTTLLALQTTLLTAICTILVGCVIKIKQPDNNAIVKLPAKTRVVIAGNASFTDLKVKVNEKDVSNQVIPSAPDQAEGNLNLPQGIQTITASAKVSCWFCPGGSNQSNDIKSFVVVGDGIRTCTRRQNATVITLDPKLTKVVNDQPGRKQIGYVLKNNNDALIIIVDDAPHLLRTQMLVEVDLDPGHSYYGATGAKMIEAWDFCQLGERVEAVGVRMLGGLGQGVACDLLKEENNYRSGCTDHAKPMLIDQATTSELWLRKRGTFGWDYKEGIDQSIWQVFGGHHLRFIWFKE